MANEEIKKLELLSEDIKNEVDELQSLLEHSDKCLLKAKRDSFQRDLSNIISNLEGLNDSVYGVYETLNSEDDSEELRNNYNVLVDILRDKLTYEEELDLRIKHNIELKWAY